MANRSSSPISPNPNLTTPEITRPSFNKSPRKIDPITPANTPAPSDFAGNRRSMGKEGKENDAVKASKLQSPAKGSKSFMAPTISAASKFTPPTRKKTLVERNELVRASVSISDGKSMVFSNLSEDLEPKSVHVSKPSKKVTFLDVPQDSSRNSNESLSDSVISDPDGSKIESSLKNSISCSPVLSSVAPLDADPSMPPYDPKTNYLSPRPQFLYYKPNPRIEVLLNREKETGHDEFKPLDYDDDDMSDNFSSDSEGTQDSEEKSESIASADMVIGCEDNDLRLYDVLCEKEKSESIASADMVIGCEDNDLRLYDVLCEKEKSESIASADMVIGCEDNDLRLYDELCEKENLVAAKLADILDGLEFSEENIIVSGESEKEKLETVASGDDMLVIGLEVISEEESLNSDRKIEKKALGVSRLLCFSMVTMMLLMAACVSVSVTRYPSLEEFGLIKDMSFSDLGQFYHQSRVVAVTNAKVIWETCASFVSKVAIELGEGEIKRVQFKYANLSDLQKGSWNDGLEDVDDDDELDSEMSNCEEEEYVDGVYESDEDFEDEVEEEHGDEVLETDEIVLEDTQNLEKQDGVDEQEDEVLEIDEAVIADSSELDSEYQVDTQNPEKIVSSSISAPLHEVLEIEEVSLVDSSELDVKYQKDTRSSIKIDPSSITTAPQQQESEFVSENEAVSSGNGDVNCADAALLEQGILLDAEPSPGKSVENSVMMSEDKFLVHYAVGISSVLAALSVAVAVFMYQYKRVPSFGVNKMDRGFDNNQKKQQEFEKATFSSQNWQTEVDDISCPSATSSFLKSESRSKNTMMMRGESVHTSETKTRKYSSRRESLASSSSEFTMGSASYGSFTTYEKIPIKNANGEEEIITPVRRSNRIRSRFTSP